MVFTFQDCFCNQKKTNEKNDNYKWCVNFSTLTKCQTELQLYVTLCALKQPLEAHSFEYCLMTMISKTQMSLQNENNIRVTQSERKRREEWIKLMNIKILNRWRYVLSIRHRINTEILETSFWSYHLHCGLSDVSPPFGDLTALYESRQWIWLRYEHLNVKTTIWSLDRKVISWFFFRAHLKRILVEILVDAKCCNIIWEKGVR